MISLGITDCKTPQFPCEKNLANWTETEQTRRQKNINVKGFKHDTEKKVAYIEMYKLDL